MTIRMLAAYPYGRHTIPAGAVVSVFDAATEAGLIGAKLALAASGAADTWAVPIDVPSMQTEVSALKVVSTSLTPAAQGVGAGALCRTSAGAVVISSADGQSWSPVSGDWEVATFADLPAANTVTPGRVYTVRGNITGSAGGAFGTQWASNGTIWRPAGGQVLWHLTAQVDGVSGGSTAEQILASPLFPARVFAGCRAIALRSRIIASGPDANSRTSRWRVGTSGSSSDAQISSRTGISATARVVIFPAHLSADGNSALLNTANSTSAASPDSDNSFSSAPVASIAVPDMTTSALYVSMSVQQGASPTAQISLQRAWIYVE